MGAMGTPAQQSGAIRADSGMVRPAQAIRSQPGSNIAMPGGSSRMFAIDAPVTDGAGPAVVRGTILPAVMRGTILFNFLMHRCYLIPVLRFLLVHILLL